MPPPGVLGGYEEVLPGAAERIVSMAEREQSHRHGTVDSYVEIENLRSRAGVRESLIGQAAAFVIAMTTIIGGMILIAFDKSAEGLTAIIGPLVALVAAFLANRLVQARSNDDASELPDEEENEEQSASS